MFSLIIAPVGIAGLGFAVFLWRLSVDIQKEKQFRAELAGIPVPTTQPVNEKHLAMAARMITRATLR